MCFVFQIQKYTFEGRGKGVSKVERKSEENNYPNSVYICSTGNTVEFRGSFVGD